MERNQLLSLMGELDRESQDTLDTLEKVVVLIDRLGLPCDDKAYMQAAAALYQLIKANQALRDIIKYTESSLCAAAPPRAGASACATVLPQAGASACVPPPPQAGASAYAPAPPQAGTSTCATVPPQPSASACVPPPPQAGKSVKPPSAPSQMPGVGLNSLVGPAGLIRKFWPRFARSSASSGKSDGIRHCRVCGNPMKQGIMICARCGSKVTAETPDVEIKKVEFSAVAPKTLTKGDYTVIKVIMYENAFRHMVDDMLKETDQETKSGVHKVSEGSEIKVILNSPDISIDDNTEVQTWQGEYLNFTFAVFLPEQYTKRSVLFDAAVYVNDVIATKLKFTVKCSTFLEQKISVTREDILSAFVSYASQDRTRVAAIIQGMRKARPDMDVFFDVDSLRSGEDWEKALQHEIEQRDILFLCWSHFARQSKWVDAEWRYALSHKGIECIEPIPIEPPGVCPPPDELKSKHFNDKLLYIINA